MILQRDKFYSVWWLLDDEGYAIDITVTEGTARPEGRHALVAVFRNSLSEKTGEAFSFTQKDPDAEAPGPR